MDTTDKTTNATISPRASTAGVVQATVVPATATENQTTPLDTTGTTTNVTISPHASTAGGPKAASKGPPVAADSGLERVTRYLAFDSKGKDEFQIIIRNHEQYKDGSDNKRKLRNVICVVEYLRKYHKEQGRAGQAQ
jgi:hypothetical protein